jgi:lipopolysaccharide biosynthesis regulator YciM
LVEIQDVNWGIKLANWLARIACELIEQNTIDSGKLKAKAILAKAVEQGPVNVRDLIRAARDLSSGDFASAAQELGLHVRLDKTGGRPRKYYERPTKT